jgi:hypothetical protein
MDQNVVSTPPPITENDNAPGRFTSTLIGIALFIAFGIFGMMYFVRNLKLRDSTTQTLAPGLTLTKSTIHAPDKNIPQYIIRADKNAGWKLNLQPAAYNVNQRASVSEIAARYNQQHHNSAPIAINGGYFAYDGAAVGAVKIAGEWQRLPWKNRTAIGWKEDGSIKIDNLQARPRVLFSTFEVPVANLNGSPAPQSATLLTDHYAKTYNLRPEEMAVVMRNNKVQAVQSSGKVLLAPQQQVLIVNKSLSSASQLQSVKVGDAARFEVTPTPADWEGYSTILGAGPRLIRNGSIDVTHVEEEFRPDVLARGPRTTLGIDRQGNLIIMIIEAWHSKIKGMTLDTVATEMLRAGAVEAINLDGGSSTTLVVNGKTVTHLSDLVVGIKIVEKAAVRREFGVANAVLLTRSTTQSSSNSRIGTP